MVAVHGYTTTRSSASRLLRERREMLNHSLSIRCVSVSVNHVHGVDQVCAWPPTVTDSSYRSLFTTSQVPPCKRSHILCPFASGSDRR